MHCPFSRRFPVLLVNLILHRFELLSKYPNIKFRLSAGCKVTSSWRFLLGLAFGGIIVDSATDSSSNVVSFSLSETSSSRISGSYSGMISAVFFFYSCFTLLFLFSLSELCLLCSSPDFSDFLT